MFSTNINEKFALPLSESLTRSLVASSILEIVASIFSITGNILVLIVYYENQKIRSKVSALFTLNLAISDLVIGLLVLPLMIFTDVFILCGEVIFLRAIIESILVPFLSTVSIWTVLFATVDRFIAIRFPFDYSTMVTRKRVHLAMPFTWLYASTWIWFPFLPGLVGKYLLMVRSFVGFLIAVTIMICWLSIYLKLRERRRVAEAPEGAHPRNHRLWYCMERKVAKLFFCVTVTLYVCLLPLWIRAICHFFGHFDNPVFEVFAITLNLLNSAVNPFIYSWTSRDFRRLLFGQLSSIKSRVSSRRM